MNRVPLAAASFLLALASAAAADEYTVGAFSGGYVVPPDLPTPTSTPAEAARLSTLLIGAKADSQSVTTTLPFQFPFFGTLYGTVTVADDGWLAFGSAVTVVRDNPELPAKAAPNAVVAALWDDLRTTKKGSVVRFTQGVAPNRTFVVAWQHMDTAADSTSADLSFEVLLHEGTGVVEIAYAAASTGSHLSFTAGIENETGTRAFGGPNLSATNAAPPADDQRFTPVKVTISGTITRDRPVASKDGLGLTTETGLPVVGARVEVVREDAAARIVVGTTLTDATGAFAADVFGIEGAPTLAVDLLAAGEESRVTDSGGKTWVRRLATGIVPVPAVQLPAVHLDASVDAVDPNFRKALNIQQAARRGHEWALAAAATHTSSTKTFPQLEIRWVQQSATASAYAPATSSAAARATISDATANPDPYDDDIVLREYGQHVLASMAAFPTTPATHQWNSAVGSEQVAFVDGFSFWFAAAVQQRANATFIDTKLSLTGSPTADVYDLESQKPAVVVTPPATPPSGVLVPGAVAASLWDLVDPSGEARDDFVGALPDSGYEVLAALDVRQGAASLPSGTTPWTISTFFDAWHKGVLPADVRARQATSRVFIHYGTFPDDAFEPNDVAGEETPFDTVKQKMTGLTLSRENADRFSFPMSTNPLSVAVSYSEATEVTVSVLDENGVEVASASSGTVTSPVLVAVPVPVPVPTSPVTYVAVVTWKSGPAALYTLGIANQPRLVTTSLPEWTADVAFNQVLQVTGGLAPVTLSIRPSVPPGLTLVNPGNGLTGRPSVPGVYDLEIMATDASGAGPQSAGTLRLTIHDALTLHDVFGLAAGHAVAADVGTGGTIAAWVPAAPTAGGLTVTGGLTLHLDGTTAGDARTFDVSGSATDSVGAAVPTSKSHVVVCDAVGVARGFPAAAGALFGFWFDALEGSRASFEFAFSGRGKAPTLAAVVDAAGTEVDTSGFVRRQGRHTKVTNLVVPRSNRYFLVFQAADAATVTMAHASVRAPTGFTAVADITTPATRVESRFLAVAGAKLTVVMTRGKAPDAATPDFIELTAPSGGTPVNLPPSRKDLGGDRVTVSGIPLKETGEYVLRVGGNEASTGPMVYEVRIVTPKSVVFSVD